MDSLVTLQSGRNHKYYFAPVRSRPYSPPLRNWVEESMKWQSDCRTYNRTVAVVVMEEINGASVIMENCGDKRVKWTTLLWLFPPSSSVTTLLLLSIPITGHSTASPLIYTLPHIDVKLIWYGSLAPPPLPPEDTKHRVNRKGPSTVKGGIPSSQCHFVQTQHHQCKLKIYYSGRKFPSHRYKRQDEQHYKVGCCHSVKGTHSRRPPAILLPAPHAPSIHDGSSLSVSCCS